MIRFLLLSLLLTFLVRAIVRVVGEAVRAYRGVPSGGPRGRQVPTAGVQMVRDPVCGTFVVPGRAPALSIAGERVHFCSSACLERYRAEHRAAAVPRGRTA